MTYQSEAKALTGANFYTQWLGTQREHKGPYVSTSVEEPAISDSDENCVIRTQKNMPKYQENGYAYNFNGSLMGLGSELEEKIQGKKFHTKLNNF